MKRRQGILKVIFCILVLMISGVFVPFFAVQADSAPALKRELFSNEWVKVSGGESSANGERNWQLFVTKKQGADTASKLQLKAEAADGSLSYRSKGDMIAGEQGWIEEPDFLSGNTQQLSLTTSSSGTELKIWIKLTVKGESESGFETSEPISWTVESSSVSQSPSSANPSAAGPQMKSAVSENGIQLRSADAALQSKEEGAGGIASADDPFSYTDIDSKEGRYPEHGTNYYDNNQQRKTVKNYDYADSSNPEGSSKITDVTGSGNLTFENGYHEYEDAYLKKIVMPTDDPNEFKVQLDVIAKSLTKKPPIDIALVIDKSNSMFFGLHYEHVTNVPMFEWNPDIYNDPIRWPTLKSAVKSFTNEVLGPGNNGSVRIGLASFGSHNFYDSDNTVFSDISRFKNNTAFTDDAGEVLDSPIYTVDPPDPSGTPTFLGLDAGYAMLTNEQFGARPDAKKVLIMITDGVPSYANGDAYTSFMNYQTDTDQENYYHFAVGKHDGDSEDLVVGNGSPGASNAEACKNRTVSFAQERAQNHKDILQYAIGLSILSDNDVSSEVFSAISPDGKYFATDEKSLLEDLAQIRTGFSVNSVQNVTINDPLSQYVKTGAPPALSALKVEEGEIKAIKDGDSDYPEYMKETAAVYEEDKITLSGLHMGENQGLRLAYSVKLKEDYQNEKYYPANGPTYLENNRDGIKTFLNFAVPSIRSGEHIEPTADIKFRKVDQDTGEGLSGAEFTIFKGETEIQKAASAADGTVSFAGLSEGTYVIRETGVPEGYAKGEDFTVEVIEDADGKLSVSNFPENSKVANLKLRSLQIMKKKPNGDQLSGASFELINDANETIKSDETAGYYFSFKGLKPGTYELKETKAPPDYSLLGEPITITIDKDGNAAVESNKDIKVIKNEDKTAISIEVTDHPITILPQTGGTSRGALIIIGSLSLIGFAGLAYQNLKRKGAG